MERLRNSAMMLGLNQPWQRAAFAFGAVTIGIWILRPRGMFRAGIPRPYTGSLKEGQEAVVEPTQVPWIIPCLAAAALLGLFV